VLACLLQYTYQIKFSGRRLNNIEVNASIYINTHRYRLSVMRPWEFSHYGT